MAARSVPGRTGRTGRTGGGTRPAQPDVWALADVVNRLRRSLRSSIRSDYPWERLPMAQVEILQRLADEPGLGVTELAARQNLAINTVSSLIQQLVVAGLAERTTSAADRRAVAVVVTERGRELLTEWLRANGRRLDRAFRGLPSDDRATIVAAVPALTRLVDRLEQLDQPVRTRGQSV